MFFILALILGLGSAIGSGYYIWKTGATGYPGSTVTPLFVFCMSTVFSILVVFYSILSICAK